MQTCIFYWYGSLLSMRRNDLYKFTLDCSVIQLGDPIQIGYKACMEYGSTRKGKT